MLGTGKHQGGLCFLDDLSGGVDGEGAVRDARAGFEMGIGLGTDGSAVRVWI